MDYFFSRIFRGFKYTLSIVGALACGVIIVMGALGISSVIIPICGGIAIIPMAFIFFENTVIIRKMEELVSKFKLEMKSLRESNLKLKDNLDRLDNQNNRLETNVTNLEDDLYDLNKTKQDLINETDKLESLLDQADNKIDSLAKLTEQYKRTSEELAVSLKTSEHNNEELKNNVGKLFEIKNDYEQSNQLLKNNIAEIEKQLKSVSDIKDRYESELTKIYETNNHLSETSKLLEKELNKTKNCYQEAKNVIQTLLQSQGIFEEIKEDMVKTESETRENVGKMSNLIEIFGEKRTKELFDRLDKDQNKVLTQEEFVNFLLN